MSADEDLVAELRAALRAAADPALAPRMRAYMKSEMPYLGVRVPAVRRLVRDIERQRAPQDVGTHLATVRILWDEATHREERYAAAVLLDTKTGRTLREMSQLPLLEHMMLTGAWWDHVDELSHRVGDLLILDRPHASTRLREWAAGGELWLRRSAIIAQLGHKSATDLTLLAETIESAQDETEFFLRKAIGWALREYARTDPAWVQGFVSSHPRLSPLSRREALKHL